MCFRIVPTGTRNLPTQAGADERAADVKAGEIGGVIHVEVEGAISHGQQEMLHRFDLHAGVAADEVAVVTDIHAVDLPVDSEPAAGLDVERETNDGEADRYVFALGDVERWRGE